MNNILISFTKIINKINKNVQNNISFKFFQKHKDNRLTESNFQKNLAFNLFVSINSMVLNSFPKKIYRSILLLVSNNYSGFTKKKNMTF